MEFSVGGGKIRDATALPKDVKKGKVFYNNQGKQTGMLESNPWSDLKYIELTIKETAETSKVTDDQIFCAIVDCNSNVTTMDMVGYSSFREKDCPEGTYMEFHHTPQFVEFLSTTKKFYLYHKESSSIQYIGSSVRLRDEKGDVFFAITFKRNGMYVFNSWRNKSLVGTKIRVYYRE